MGIAFAIISLVLVGAGALVVHSAPRFAASLLDAMNQAQDVGYQISSNLNLPRAARFESLDLHPYVSGMLLGIRRLATNLLLVVIYLGFLLASRRTFDQKVARLFHTDRAREHAERVFHRVRHGTESYVGLQAFKGVLLGVVFFVVMKVFGLQNAIFAWASTGVPGLLHPDPGAGGGGGGAGGPGPGPVRLRLAAGALMFVGSLQATVIAIDSVLLPRLQGEQLERGPGGGAGVPGLLEP